eukprot:1517197-Ditylum_brightwellii.AAC.1
MSVMAMNNGLHKTWKRQQGGKTLPLLKDTIEPTFSNGNLLFKCIVVTAHGKSNFELFDEKHKRLNFETFPKKAKEVKKFLDYELLANNHNQNVSFILHAR